MVKRNTAVLYLIISITALQIIELVYTLNSLNKGNSFALMWIVFVIILILSSVNLLADFKIENYYFKGIFFIFVLYELVIVIRGWSFSAADLTTYLREDAIFWPFLIPLFVFFDKQFSTLIFLTKCFYYLGIFFLLIILFFPSLLLYRISAETFINAFVPGCGFLLLNSLYLNSKKINISFLIIFLATLSTIYLARRSSSSVLIEFILISYFFNIKSKHPAFLFKLLPFLLGIGIFTVYAIPHFNKVLTQKMNDRLLEDSRDNLYSDFLKDMNDYIYFGKGLNGKYYFPMAQHELEGDQEAGVVFNATTYRNNAENGYLQLILTGGVVHVILFMLVLLPASFHGIFRSSNQFSKACGVIILLQLINMLVVSTPNLSILYILVWISVGVCYKTSIRKKTDQEIQNEFLKFHFK